MSNHSMAIPSAQDRTIPKRQRTPGRPRGNAKDQHASDTSVSSPREMDAVVGIIPRGEEIGQLQHPERTFIQRKT